MKNNELISVIIPIYKVEDYLPRCLESVLNQSYQHLEILLIDDGSPDNCPTICEEYAKKDTRIKVINQENAGLSAARNKGLELATGNYITFIDSDDYIDNQMLEKLYSNLLKNSADISIANFYYEYPDGKLEYQNYPQYNSVATSQQKFYNIYNQYGISTIVAWGKLYKRTLFNTIRFPIGKLHEDEYILFEILTKANSLCYLDEPLYHYLQRAKSITTTFNIQRLDIVEVYQTRIKQLQTQADQLLLKLTYLSYLKVLAKIIIPGLKSLNEKEKTSLYQKETKKLIVILKNFDLSKIEKLELFIIQYLQPLYPILSQNKLLKKIKNQ